MGTELIKCQIKFKPEGIVYNKCYITIDKSEYWLIIYGDVRQLSQQTRKWNDSVQYKVSDDFEFLSAYKNNNLVNVNVCDSHILDIVGMSNKIKLKINAFSYSYEYGVMSYYFLSPSSKILLHHMNNQQLLLNLNNKEFRFCYDSSLETIRVAVVSSDDNTEEVLQQLLGLLSFYLRIPIELWMKEISKNGKTCRQYFSLNYKSVMEDKNCNNINYLQINGEFLSLNAFISNCHYFQTDPVKRKIIDRGLERYVASEYLDDITKFIYLVSIIHTYAEKVNGFKGGCQYNQVEKLLDKYNIDPKIMNEGISFQSLRNGGTCDNFIEVRNELLHALPSQEMIDMIEEKELVRKADFCALIIILRELDYSNIKFCEDFKSLNILKL